MLCPALPPLDGACNGGQTLFAGGTFQKNGGCEDGHDCSWLLTCPDGESPTVLFSEFQTENNFDFVTVYNGDTADADQIVRCSGGSCDGGIGNQQNMLVRLTSDGSVTQDGFVASFSCQPAAVCNGEDMVVDYAGGFHASGHGVFDGYDNYHNALATADATVAVADPLDGCMGGADGQAADTLTGNFADGSMTGKIALIRRGVCLFTTKTMNAQNAGAIGAVIFNDDRVGLVNMGGPSVGITIPSIFIDGVDGDALAAAVTADPTIIGHIHCDAESRNEQPPNACGAPDSGPADYDALPGDYTVACGDTFGLDVSPDHMTNCVWTMAQQGSVTFTNFVSEGGWDFLNVWSDASLVVNVWGPAGSNGGVDNAGDLGQFSGTTQPGTIAGVGAVQLITDWSYTEPNTGFSATLTC